MTHDEIRKCHYDRLRDYLHSAEYAEYVTEPGANIPQGPLPSLLGKRWEIDEKTYMEFLEVLPPLAYHDGSFYLSEFTFGDITTKYTKEGDRYYCEFARYQPQRQQPVETPWGHPDTVKEIAPGIVLYSTPSHGGYWPSPARVAAMPKPLRDFQPFAGRNWYEEDCDWSIVALAFPQFFPHDAIAAARETLKHYKPELYEQIVAAGTQHGRK
ncbi:MAG TPA: hypothetical protein VH592_23785 [Gemmataceae bacterium]|jgi:hypothetical protein